MIGSFSLLLTMGIHVPQFLRTPVYATLELVESRLMTPKLYGPFPLTDERIDDNVVSSPGVYALGYTRGDEFVIAYLGRADDDLKTELTAHARGTYPLFKFAYALSAEDAFAKQCELYHETVGLENDLHPNPPHGSEGICPRCKTWRPFQRVLTA